MRSRGSRLALTLALSLAVLLAVAGCSDLPTKPQLDGSSATATDTAIATDTAPAEVLGLNLLGGGSSSTTTKTKTIGLLGGTVAVGNFTIIVPPAALLQTATITVSQPDLTKPVVNLSISPASANHFLLPVLLVADARPMDRSLLSIATIGYYNPATGQWETVPGCVVSLLDLTVTAPLFHFSTYRVQGGGKAGW